jgi:ribonucleoside-diphosphate reductase alpha chain
LETFISKFTNMQFEPAGMTDDADIRMSKSIMDYVFRRLALDYMDFDTRSALGIYTAEERQRYLDTGSHQPISAGSTAAELISDEEAGEQEAEAVAKEVSVDADGGRVADSVDGGRVEATESPRIETTKSAPSTAHSSAELLEVITGAAIDSPLCMNCGTKMRPAGSCHVCDGCGSTSGCS